jgi:hypothetical protein
MTTLTAPDEPRPATAPPAGPRLRLRRAGRPERVVEVREGKCSIGSSPRCQVQLPAGEAQPLQCLVTLEAGAATVTRWAAGVLFNGREFSKHALRAGDRLSIGPWELEWQSGAASGTAIPPSARRPAQPPVDRTPQPSASPLGPVSVVEQTPPAPWAAAAPVTASPGPPESAPAASPRPAAKTVLVSSRLTETFGDLLGPAPPAPAVASVNGERKRRLADPASAAFEDRLVLSLWSANFTARRRARALVKAGRAARVQVAELTAELAKLDSQLAASQSAGDAQAAELSTQLAAVGKQLAAARQERDRAIAELEELRDARARTAPQDPRVATLTESLRAAERESHSLRTQLGVAEEQLKMLRKQGAAADAARVAAEQALAERQAAPQTAADADEAANERAAWEAKLAAAVQEAALLRDQLNSSQADYLTLKQVAANADAARAELADQIEALQAQQQQWLAECSALETQRATRLTEVVAQRDELQRQLQELAAMPEQASPAAPRPMPGAALAAPGDPGTAWPESATATPAAASDEHAAAEPAAPWAWDSNAAGDDDAPPVDDSATDAVETPGGWGAAEEAVDAMEPTGAEPSADEASAAQSAPAEPAWRGPMSLSEPMPAAEPAPYAPTSFIDKYRHLLEEGGDADSGGEPSPRLSRPVLDEEYLSPQRGELPPAPSEEADEALEAYMSNLMRRVRGGAPAATAATSAAKGGVMAAILGEAPPPESDVSAATNATPEFAEPEIELDANGMLRLVRKPQHATDLTALRELANSTARTAIARHRERRHAQSAASKAIICGLASAASGVLMWTAPAVNSPWFWGGCATLAAAVGTAAQLAALAWRRRADRQSTFAAATTAAHDVELPAIPPAAAE